MTESSVELMTPSMAAALLDKQHFTQRPLSLPTARRYAAMMLAGKWAARIAVIVIDSQGRLLDGQHRLKAVVIADIPVAMLITRGADQDSVINIDCGLPRSANTRLTYANGKPVQYGSSIIAAARLVVAEQATGAPVADYKATDEDVLDHVRSHLDRWAQVIPLAHSVGQVKTQVVATAKTLGWLLWHTIDHPEVHQYWRAFGSQANLPSSDPRWAMNRYYVNNPTALGVGAQSRESVKVRCAALASCWNASLAQKSWRRPVDAPGAQFPLPQRATA